MMHYDTGNKSNFSDRSEIIVGYHKDYKKSNGILFWRGRCTVGAMAPNLQSAILKFKIEGEGVV